MSGALPATVPSLKRSLRAVVNGAPAKLVVYDLQPRSDVVSYKRDAGCCSARECVSTLAAFKPVSPDVCTEGSFREDGAATIHVATVHTVTVAVDAKGNRVRKVDSVVDRKPHVHSFKWMRRRQH